MHEHDLNSTDSPCVKKCAMNGRGYCTGCWRSLKELAEWMGKSDEERRRIMAELPKRANSNK